MSEAEAELEEIQAAMARDGWQLMRTSKGPSDSRICKTPEQEARDNRDYLRLVNRNIDLELEVERLKTELALRSLAKPVPLYFGS